MDGFFAISLQRNIAQKNGSQIGSHFRFQSGD
ncbi:hypothetical protein Vch1786_I0190 [Vibrio cholerae O1 str. 2010EL-1786]|uniref:Uncharacterized protein n=2 Tax=Vibrio cholerae TaxID=666 RepID=Q9KU43_VIBCH|nr:hypothetical protein VC_0686 [Vibrio cholerae O1 biovar El Tor str. N16961]ACP04967.1 conserved hypothetical protein [Vibrio cholerae M66-2]AET25805.1 hypothetical protein Vch1786_I0190 [Vibrio cholerae O1 str. 2010EL-1786]